MKRSKIFLVTTTALLAVVGVFASKAHRFNPTVGGYVTNPGLSNGCTVYTGVIYSTRSTTGSLAGAATQFTVGACPTNKHLYQAE